VLGCGLRRQGTGGVALAVGGRGQGTGGVALAALGVEADGRAESTAALVAKAPGPTPAAAAAAPPPLPPTGFTVDAAPPGDLGVAFLGPGTGAPAGLYWRPRPDGTSNGTELEKLKKRLQLVLYCIDRFVFWKEIVWWPPGRRWLAGRRHRRPLLRVRPLPAAARRVLARGGLHPAGPRQTSALRGTVTRTADGDRNAELSNAK
jgi:hypothetical protein